MRPLLPSVLIVVVLSACGGTNDPGNPEITANTPETPTLAFPTDDVEAARVTADLFYDAVGQHDCITMRGLSTTDEQRNDDEWAECVDLLLEVAGDDFGYTLDDPTGATGATGSEGATVTFTVVSHSMVDGELVQREDPLVLLDEGGTWRVQDSVVTAG